MNRPPKGIYYDRTGDIRFAGYRKLVDPSGLTWETVTDTTQRDLLRTESLVDLRWNGTTVVRRDQTEINARIRAEMIEADNAHFEREREKAILLSILDELNILRKRFGLAPRTIQQVKVTYNTKLNRS